jgi:hypothetical protein
MPDVSLDWSTALKSPLILFLPVTILTAILTWMGTEISSFWVPSKYRPAVALLGGPFLGWAVNRTEILDFGWGPNGWGRALVFGLFAGFIAVLGHNRIKSLPIFRNIAAMTPSAAPEPPPGP